MAGRYKLHSGNLVLEGDLTVEGNITSTGDFSYGDETADSLTITATSTVVAANKLQFRDAGLYVNSSVDGQLDVVADTTAKVTAPTIELTGAVVLDSTETTGLYVSGAATTGLKFDHVTTQRAIDIQITPTVNDRQLYMVIDYVANTKEAAYVIAKSTATTGELMALRGRAESEATGAATGEARGMFGQGIATATNYAGTCTGVQGNAIAKDTSTVVTLRGGFFEAESESTPTSITNLYGTHTRVKTSVAPGTDFVVSLLETEKFGGGIATDSFLRFKTTTWTGGETVSTDVISLADLTGTVTNLIDYSGPTCTSVLYSSGTATNFLETSADSKGGAGATRVTPNQTAVCDGSLVVKIGSKTLLVPLYNAVTIA